MAEVTDNEKMRAPLPLWETTECEVDMLMKIMQDQHKIVNDSWVGYRTDSISRDENPDIYEWFSDNCRELQKIFSAIYAEDDSVVVIAQGTTTFYVCKSGQKYGLAKFKLWPTCDHLCCLDGKVETCTDDEFDYLVERLFGQGQGYLVGVETNPGPLVEHNFNIGYELISFTVANTISYKQIKDWLERMEKPLIKMLKCKTIKSLEYSNVAVNIIERCTDRKMIVLSNILLASCSHRNAQAVHISMKYYSKDKTIRYVHKLASDIYKIPGINQVGVAQSQMFAFNWIADDEIYNSDGSRSSDEDKDESFTASFFQSIKNKISSAVAAYNTWASCTTYVSAGLQTLQRIKKGLMDAFSSVLKYLPQIARALSVCFIAIILYYAANVSRAVCNFLLRCMAEEDEIEVYDEPLPGQSQTGIVSSILSLIVFASTFMGKGPIDANKVLAAFNASHTAISKVTDSDMAKSISGYVEPIVKSFLYKYLGWEFEATETERISGWLSEVYNILMDPNLDIKITSDDKFRERVIDVCKVRDGITAMAATSGYKMPPNVSTLFTALMALEKKVEFSKNRCASRVEPQTIYIAGPTAQGKTFMLDVLAANLMAHDQTIAHYGDFKPDVHMYCKQKESEYWEEYNGQPFVVFNDAFIGSTTESNMTEAKMLMGVCEGGSYACNMAFDRKGKTYFNSPYVMITSNRPNFHNVGLFTKDALERRMNFPVYVQRKKQGSSFVDYDASKNNIDACWEFYVIDFGCPSWLSTGIEIEGTSTKMIKGFRVYEQPIHMSTLIALILKRRTYTIDKKLTMDSQMTKDNILKNSHIHLAQSQMKGMAKGSFEKLLREAGKSFEKLKEDAETELDKIKVNITDKMIEVEEGILSVSPVLTFVATEEIDFAPGLDNILIPDDLDYKPATGRHRLIVHRYVKSGRHYFMFNEFYWEVFLDRKKAKLVNKNELFLADEMNGVIPSHKKVLGVTWYISCLAASAKEFFLKLQKSVVDGGSKAFQWIDNKVDAFVNQIAEYSTTAPSSVMLIAVIASVALIAAVAGSIVHIMMEKFKPKIREEDDNLSPLEDYCAFSQSKFNHVGDAPKKMTINSRYHMPKKVSQMYNPFEGIVSFMNNSRILEIQLENGHQYDTNILMISDKVGFIVKHAVSFGPICQLRVYGVSGEAPVSFLRSNVQIKDFPDRDLARIKFEQSIGFCKNYVSKLKSNQKQPSNVYKPIRLIKGMVGDDSVKHYASEGKELVYKSGSETCSMVTQYGEFLETRFKGYYVMIDGGGFMGACGFPVRLPVTSNDNEWLIGIHIGQVGNDSLVCPIYKEDCIDATSQMNIFRESRYDLNLMKGSKSKNTNMAPAFTKSLPFSSEKSNLVSTRLEKDIYEAFPAATKMYPAKLGSQAYNNAIAKYDSKVKQVAPNSLLEQYANSHPEIIFSPLCPTPTKPKLPNFDFADRSTIEQLVKAATLGGSVVDRDNNRWDFDSFKDIKAAGPPDFGKKTAYWNVEEKTISMSFVNDMICMIETILDGENFVLSVKDDLKDELREEERVKDHKTRLFCSANTHQCVLQKILFMPIVQYLKNHRSVQPIQCGINVHGNDWNNLANHVLRHPNYIGGDQSGQDITIPREFSKYLFKYLDYNFICDSKTYKVLLRAMCETMSTTLHHGRGYTYFYLRGNPSGQWVTSLYSSFSTVLVMSYAFVKGCIERGIEVNDSVFKENLSFAAFGDDNVGSVSDAFKWYNNVYLLEQFASFGMEFTNPTKTAINKEFLDRQEVNFLCREFKETRLSTYYSAPLALDSILGMVTYVNKPKDEDTIETKLLEVVSAVECELCHYTRAEANLIEKKLNKIFKKNNYNVRIDHENYLNGVFLPSLLKL